MFIRSLSCSTVVRVNCTLVVSFGLSFLDFDPALALLFIDFTTARARGLGILAEVEIGPAPAEPAVLLSWVAVDQSVVGYVFSNHSPGTDKSISANAIAADNSGVSPDSSTFLDQCWLEFVLS